jgi:hypothetical protein
VLHWCLVISDARWSTVDEKNIREIGLVQELYGHASLGKERKTHIYNMAMFSFRNVVLLVSVGARNRMRYPYASKEGIQLVIFYSPIHLNGFNLPIQESFVMMLEIMELSKILWIYFSHNNYSFQHNLEQVPTHLKI